MISLLLAASAVIVAPVPKTAKFQDWLAACNNVRHCEAVAMPRLGRMDGEQRDWSLHLSRGAGSNAGVFVAISPAFGDGEWSAARLRVDGRPIGGRFEPKGEAVRVPLPMLRQLASARQIEVTDETGKRIGSIPVKGASAALRWLDDRQQRAGTVTAMIAKGSRPPSAIPAPPKLPRIATPKRSGRPARLLSDKDIRAIQRVRNLCEPGEAKATTYRLDASHSVGIVDCMTGAYQSAYLVVIVDERGRWSLAKIEQPEPPGGKAWRGDAYLVTEADYVEGDRLLTMNARGRGPNDCGQSASWAWDGKVFRLASYSSLDECRGVFDVRMSRWQTANDPLTGD